jgi:serine/threonine protein kinase
VKSHGGTLPTDEVRRVAAQIINGLQGLHNEKVVHRDLKPSNILHKEDRYFLTDFGISKDMERAGTQATFRGAGTSGYCAPEQMMSGREAHPSADVYALGKLIVFMLTGATDIDLVFFRQWRNLIKSCTTELAEDRPTLEKILTELEQIEE